MFMSSKTAVLAIAALAAISAPITTNAQEIRIGPGGITIDEGGREYRGRSPRSRCSPREAVAKASNYLSDPQIQSIDRQYVAVDGFGRKGEPNRVVFWNDYGCPRADN